MTARCVVLTAVAVTALAVVPAAAQSPEVGEVFRDCEVCPEMVVVPAGSFMMGSPETEEGRYDNEGPLFQVTIESPFAVGVYEVTFDEWDACVSASGCGGHRPEDYGRGRGKRAVYRVSWHDAWLYADWLTEQTGREYRLLSEAEWEYVARAGTHTSRYWGDSDRDQCRYANGYDATGEATLGFDFQNPVGCRDRQGRSAPVGSYQPNGFGLHDVLGNLLEWVDDCWNEGYDGAPTDGSSWYSGDCSLRVHRGGDYTDISRHLRSARRTRNSPGLRHYSRGFRVARSIP